MFFLYNIVMALIGALAGFMLELVGELVIRTVFNLPFPDISLGAIYSNIAMILGAIIMVRISIGGGWHRTD